MRALRPAVPGVLVPLSAAVVAAAAAGCGPGATKIGAQPSWRARGTGAAGAADDRVRPADPCAGAVPEAEPPPRLEPIVLEPTTPAVAAYNDPPRADARPTPVADAITDAVVRVAREIGAPAPVPDGRLQAAADELAAVVPERVPLPYPVIEFALQRHGIIEPSPHIIVIWGPDDDPVQTAAQLEGRLPDILAAGAFSRVGVGSASRGSAGEAVILALQSSHVATGPIPRVLPDGGGFELAGTVAAGYEDTEVFVTRDGGQVEELELRRTKRGGFAARFSCGAHRGRQQVEITASDASGSTVLANFPVWCRARPPARLTVEPTEDDTSPVTTAADAEARMLALVNRARARHSAPPLVLDPQVVEVARAHSREMQRTGVVAHISPTTGSAADRVKAAGIRTALVLENVARAYGVAEAHSGLMNSPGHRANVLSVQATNIGIGIVLGDVVAGRREMFVTQVFTRVPPALAPGEAERLIAAKMRAYGRLTPHAPLSALAREYAIQVAAGRTPEEVGRQIARKLRPLAGQFKRVATVVTTVADVDAFDAASAIGPKPATHYGLGVAQGSHEEIGDNAIFVVLLIGDAR